MSEKALAIQKYQVLSRPIEEIQATIRMNLGNDTAIRATDLDRITFPTGGNTSWSVPTLEGEVSVTNLDCIIIGQQNIRVYWEDEYTGGGNPPDCSSSDGVFGKGIPGGSCAKCPFNEWGSSVRAGKPQKGKACKEVTRLFVLLPDQSLPVMVATPPSSQRELKAYMRRLSSNLLPHNHVVTRISLQRISKEGVPPYAQMVLKVVGTLTPEQQVAMDKYSTQINALLSVRDVVAEDYYREDEQPPVK